MVKFIFIPIDSGQLFYIGLKGKANRRVPITDLERRPAFIHCHNSPQGGHMGRHKTIEKINYRYDWSGLYVDVLQWIAECGKCQNFEQIKTVAPQLKPIKTSGPWEVVAIDLI